jgi:hypothetical protein
MACTRPTSGASNVSPTQIYSASPTESDVRSALGSQDWWATVPSFMVRPLDLPNTPETVRFEISNHFVHIGTSEVFFADYTVFSATSDATTYMTNLQSQVPTATGPKEGDQAVYYGSRPATTSALYATGVFVRLGQIVINFEWQRDAGFADLNTLAALAGKNVSKLKDVLAGKVTVSPLPATDSQLLPPPGLDVTLVGTAQLPVESAAAAVGSGAPEEVVSSLQQLGVKDFLYGDYALNADLTMEVKAAVVTFNSSDDANSWFTAEFGSTAATSGILEGYSDVSGQYYAFFPAGAHVAMLFCSSTTPLQAASRACETPLGDLINNWHASLSQ